MSAHRIGAAEEVTPGVVAMVADGAGARTAAGWDSGAASAEVLASDTAACGGWHVVGGRRRRNDASGGADCPRISACL